MDKLDRIIQVLSLVNSDKRDATLQNLILYILHVLNDECSVDEITSFISEEFGVTFSKDELKETIKDLWLRGSIREKHSKYSISKDVSEQIEHTLRNSKEQSEILFREFEAQISALGATNFSERRKRELFQTFQEYLCECIYQFGRSSIHIFKRDSADFQDKRLKVLRSLLVKIKDKDERDVITKFIKTFPETLTTTQINLINDLVERSEDFYSLGLSNEQSDELKSADFLNWIFFLDTNVLYSILDLHIHPENEAARKIIEIIREHPSIFKIKLSYLQKTHNELKKKRQVFEENIPKTIYSESQIRAMLTSQKLDSFSERYLQKMLEFGEDTPHPTESIDQHITILKAKGIEINRRDLAIDENSEHFAQCISDYKRVESILNDAKLEKNLQMKPPKDLEKVEHDIFLREAIKRFRVLKPASLNDCKYFGLTLDSYLMKYDHYQLKRDIVTSDIIFPTFFRPAFILSKLIKLVPVKTDDYKKAFVKSLLALSISDGKKKHSRTVLKTVSRFKAMGLEDQSVILNCITDDFFLKKIEDNPFVEKEDELIESLLQEKIERKITAVEVENDSLKEQLAEVAEVHAITNAEKTALEIEVGSLKLRYQQTEDDLRVFRKEFEKFKSRKEFSRRETQAVQLSIQDSDSDEKPRIEQAQTIPQTSAEESVQSSIDGVQSEQIINWRVLRRRLYTAGEYVANIFLFINILFALFFAIVGCMDFENVKTYFIIAGVGAFVAALFKITSSKRLRWKLIIEFLALLLFATFLTLNYSRIVVLINSHISKTKANNAYVKSLG